ncbi:hypothetical protein GRJ2_001932300 [Grus japonensis]|uniref:Uncharacterized protein n=1 Tax=Grus japonensis TaxID=30415 RepID=A0ABC9XC29_GRUJA
MRRGFTSRELRFPGGRARGLCHLLPLPHRFSQRRLARCDAAPSVVTRKVCARHSNRGRRGVCGAERRSRGQRRRPSGALGRQQKFVPVFCACPGRSAHSSRLSHDFRIWACGLQG